MPFGTYRELAVWQKAFDLACDVYQLTRGFPPDERFGMTAQLRRAATSISNNIAEGHGRATLGEFLNSLSVARGSLNEVENCLLISQQLHYAADSKILPYLKSLEEISRMLAKFRAQLKRRTK